MEEQNAAKKRKVDDGHDTEPATGMPEGHYTAEHVGIEEYVSEGSPFSGILKHRFSDFIVNEIGLDGKEIRLTSLGFEVAAAPADESPAVDAQADRETATADPYGELAKTQTDETVGLVREFVESEAMAPALILPADGDKSRRTQLHLFIKSVFPGLVSDTVRNDAGDICIRIYRKGQAGGRSEDLRKAKAALPGDYCEFYLYKSQRDTNSAVGVIAKLGRLPPKSLTYAGTKDKRAITCQRVRCYKARAEDLHSLNGRLYGMRLSHYSYHKEPLRLGDLLGNKFTVVMRNVTGITDEALTEKLHYVKTKGFINYFGMQRFGTSAIGTHEIGRALLKGDYQTAVDLILRPRASEEPEVAAARRYYADNPGDYNGAIRKFPKWCNPEIAVLSALSKDSNNYQAAIMRVARNIRLMYVHAYQSYIWNKMATARVRLHGLKVMPGDLVVEGNANGLDKPDDVEAESGSAAASSKFVQARVVTEDDVAENRFQMTDIVLPMPGFDIIYPANEMAEKYWHLLKEDLGVKDYDWRHPNKDFALSGAYRKVLVIPQDLEWDVVRYNGQDDQITYSDLERLQNDPAPQLPKDGSHRALIMSFTLPASAYATMLFRELTRCETHAQYHAAKSGNLAVDQ